MGKRKLGALEKVDADLPNLQHKIRCDPQSYQGDFERQYRQYGCFRDVVMRAPASAPTDDIVSLRDLLDFISHVAHCYPDITNGFPQDLIALLSRQHDVLEPMLREKIVTSLVLLRKKGLLDSASLINVLFPILLSTQSKSLRTLLYQKILSDLRTSNAKTTNHKVNRALQTTLFNLVVSDRSSSKGVWASRITRELWRRQLWDDARAVEIMKEAALSENTKVILGGVNFFLGGDKEREEHAEDNTSDEGDEVIDMGKLRHQVGINKKSKKREKDLKNAKNTVKKRERKKNQPHPLNFSALHLLHDPQGFAEALFSRHLQSGKSKLNLNQKLQVLQLVSRLVGLHRLTVLSLYSYFLKFLTPRQAGVTSFLASLAQATHNLVPPDTLEPLILKIANEFVSEASAGQVAASGLNAIREICARQPLAMNGTLLQDLIMYRKSKDKGVMMAAKGLLSLYRDVGPDMLKKRDRGKDAAMGMRSAHWQRARFGEEVSGEIEGLEILEAWREEMRKKNRAENGTTNADDGVEEGLGELEDEEDGWNEWDAEENDSDDSGGWIDVLSSGEDDIEIADSENGVEDSKRAIKKQKIQVGQSAAEEGEGPKAIQRRDDESNSKVSSLAAEVAAERERKVNSLATTRILTPADLTKLHELRQSSAVSSLLTSKRTQRNANATRGRAPQWMQSAINASDAPAVTAEGLEEISKIGQRATKAEKIAAAKGENGEKERHKGGAAKRQERKREQGKSSTNKEKAKGKNFLMTLGKARSKGKRSLTEMGKAMRADKERRKRGGRRGNR